MAVKVIGVHIAVLILASVSTSLLGTEVADAGGDDELHIVCSDREFACGDGTCIPLTWHCDASADCDNLADEKDCDTPTINCTAREFSCKVGGMCIPDEFHCDGDADCTDASDEKDCAAGTTCAPGHFDCGTQNCIPHRWVCDGDTDCANGADEQNCKNASASVVCTADQFKCKGNYCIDSNWVCDGEPDCRENEDEENCEKKVCADTEFRCTSGQCIKKSQQCDGQSDCDDRSDEENCKKQKVADCQKGEFRCLSDGSCIKSQWRCDGDADCSDGSDEKKCPKRRCSSQEFRCKDGSCIPERWTCDGDPDCAKGEDERHCKAAKEEVATCGKNEFTCADENCIKAAWHCDGDKDCSDGSDEKDCVTPCKDDEFQCNDLSCIPFNSKCDGKGDCSGREDENNCTTVSCNPGQFQCHKSQLCIGGEMQCDGQMNCEDGSDEENCPQEITGCVPIEEFDCNGDGKHCLPLAQVCDGKNDCEHWQDEAAQICNKTNPCLEKNGGCSHICRFTPTCADVLCLCPEGYQLTTNNKTCHDIDECEISNECDQLCMNTNGSYECGCYPGYVPHPDDLEMCKAIDEKKILYVSQRESLLSIDLSYDKTNAPETILKEKHDANYAAIDIDIVNNAVFMADTSNENLISINMSSVDKNAEVVARHMVIPDGIAFDWLHRNLYWADAGSKVIGVQSLAARASVVLVSNNLNEPRAIVVDPRKQQGWMYWTDWGRRGRIEKAGLDGSHRHTLVNRNIAWPNGITLDYAANRLYWVDAKFHWIVSCNLQGLDRTTVLSRADIVQHPYSIAVFENWLYWTDWSREAVLKTDKVSADHITVMAEGLRSPMGIAVCHPLRQPNDTARCPEAGSPDACSHLCLATPYLNSESPTFKCACPQHSRLTPDGRRCKGIRSTRKHERQLRRLALRGERNNLQGQKRGKKSQGHSGHKRGHRGHKHKRFHQRKERK